jgi:putative SOS response-associated peptidase YedK
MCGRFTLTCDDVDDVAAELEADLRPEDAPLYRPRYNVAPTNAHWLVRLADGRRQLVPATWGLVAGEVPLINARIETAASKPTFRDAFRSRRCVVPSDGFIEWAGPSNDRRPLWFRASQGGLLLLAGFFEDATADGLPRFVILTMPANETIAPVHDRMPVILTREQVKGWLEAPSSSPPAEIANGTLVGTEVSSRVNSPANDDPECLAPPSQPQSPKQLRLF